MRASCVLAAGAEAFPAGVGCDGATANLREGVAAQVGQLAASAGTTDLHIGQRISNDWSLINV